MKILLANKYFYLKGGAENSFFETARLLKEKGHEISFFSMKHLNNIPSPYEKFFTPNVDYDKPGFWNKIDVSAKLLYSFEARRKVERLLKREQPQVAHLNVIYHQISPSIIHSLRRYKIPIVMSLRDYKLVCASYAMVAQNTACDACKDSKYFQCYLKKCVKDSKGKSLLNAFEMYLHHKILKIYDKIHTFISPSRFLKNKFLEMGFKGNIVYLPNFVDLKTFQPNYGYEENSIIYFGRISKEKGIFTLIEAVKSLPQVKLKIVGQGPVLEDLKAKVKKDNQNNVVFYGYLNGFRLKEEVSKSMFVVLPSEWYENNPRSIIEGFALGKPAVGARIGGIPELVIDNVTGLTFESGNSLDLRGKILSLINDPDKVSLLGRNARKFAQENLNQETHYQKLIQIYHQAIGRQA